MSTLERVHVSKKKMFVISFVASETRRDRHARHKGEEWRRSAMRGRRASDDDAAVERKQKKGMQWDAVGRGEERQRGKRRMVGERAIVSSLSLRVERVDESARHVVDDAAIWQTFGHAVNRGRAVLEHVRVL